ncbi:MAG: methyltransferase domain-containing protein [Planctomycetes bacterium]|nr:methyltransferase domain-containing protein [Planctomycetota bacterium]
MDFSGFDTRNYKTLPVADGYAAWSRTYDKTVRDLLDLPLLERIHCVDWSSCERAADLACGTGRSGAWLVQQGVKRIDGIDLTPEMIELARRKEVYDRLHVSDVADTPLESAAYDLCIMVLADEHLEDLRPVYHEAARLTRTGGRFVIVGYHPHFMLMGIPPHFHPESGEPLAITSYLHFTSDHVRAAHAAGWSLLEMHERLIDEACIAAKPKWEKLLNHPISFAMVWSKARADSGSLLAG